PIRSRLADFLLLRIAPRDGLPKCLPRSAMRSVGEIFRRRFSLEHDARVPADAVSAGIIDSSNTFCFHDDEYTAHASGTTSSAAVAWRSIEVTYVTPTTPAIVSALPTAVRPVMRSPRKTAPRKIEIRTASCEMTPTVIASTQRKLNVSSSCAIIANSAVASRATHSWPPGVFHPRSAN